MAPDRYEAALAYLFSATDYEKMRRVRYNADTFSLDRMRRLLEALGSPERGLRAVHVAGTKGKGSTAAMVHAIALECGLTAGLYTSPHLEDIRERIRVGPRDIAPEDLADLIDLARPHVERMRAEGDAPTFFEIFTALAFVHFARVGVDLVVAEVGLGGRLDATNVLAPDVSVITAISLDHMAQLGGTLAAIAAEKAGIVKPRVPVVSQPQPVEAMAAIRDACREAGSPLVLVGRDVTYTWEPAAEAGRPGGRLTVRTPDAAYSGLFLPLMGEHQALNAAAAVAAAERAGPLARRISRDVVRRALAAVRWPGRMEHRPGPPETVLDGAHNRASIERLAEALGRHFPGRRPVVVFGSAADKDVDGMLAAVVERMPGAAVLFARSQNPRAADAADLAARFVACGGGGAETFGDVASALAAAARRAAGGGLVVVCGSLYLVGEARGLLAAGRAAPEVG
ncbi:MAG: bifunctional folylpolyglutamate synthase/dihydrofolate synthase [Planctomycetes bacterium]|nr:bifunctional folylpolyglutamate synthase/dihydrofolate synthase [Planctomycetota bacterium]